MGSDESFVLMVCVLAVLFAGEPDIADALRQLIVAQSVCK